MKKVITLGVIISLMSTMIVFADETEFFPTYEQTASAYLDQDGNEVKVTVDLTGGWSVEFAPGAVYLYDGTVDENTPATALGITLDEDVFQDHLKAAQEIESYREFARSFAYTEEDGTNDYFFSLGPDTFFMISVSPDADGDIVSSRFSVERVDFLAPFAETETE